MKKRLLALLALALVLAACTRSGENSPVLTTPLPPKAAVKAQQELAGELGIDPNWITIQEVQAKQWSNTCLDAQAENEICAEQITPGYRIILTYDGTTYTYHTDLEGNQIREPRRSSPFRGRAPSPSASGRLLGYAPEDITIVSEESVRFADSCLEITYLKPPALKFRFAASASSSKPTNSVRVSHR